MRMFASIPSSNALPCAARPKVSTSIQQNPLCASPTTISVGSVTIAASAVTWRSTSWMPMLATSSSATAAISRSPASVTPASRSARTAVKQAASPPFMSKAPRPWTRPSRASPEKGSAIPSIPTVSMCA